jgi:hypothetical protein
LGWTTRDVAAGYLAMATPDPKDHYSAHGLYSLFSFFLNFLSFLFPFVLFTVFVNSTIAALEGL